MIQEWLELFAVIKMIIPKTPETFSQYFKLNKSQDDLDFLDIYAARDIQLFLDPYGIASMGTKLSEECESQIATYFQFLLESIQKKDKKTTKRLLEALHEVNEISLGYSQNQPEGRGIGPAQAKELQDAFETSEAAKSGDIKDIADCAILIPGINRDKISDITANILKNVLINFTQEQCKKHKIPMKKVAVTAFEYQFFTFKSFYAELPIVYDKPKILLPISSVRRAPELSKDRFYRNFVLEYLKAEHSHAGDSLASVLQNGKIKVKIADLKEKYPLDTKFLYDFSKSHPLILQKYKSELRIAAAKKITPILKIKPRVLTAEERINFIKKVKSGKENADQFHKISFDNLIHVFGDRLSKPKSEIKINGGRKRIDIGFNNSDESGFFHKLNILHHIMCPKIYVECKNYGKEIGNPEIDQLLGRFSDKRGRFGIVLCRTLENKNLMLQRCKDVMNDHKSYILVFTDTDMQELLTLKEKKLEQEIDEYLEAKLDELIM